MGCLQRVRGNESPDEGPPMNLLRRVLTPALSLLPVLVFQLVTPLPCAGQAAPGSAPPQPVRDPAAQAGAGGVMPAGPGGAAPVAGPGQGSGRSAQLVDPKPRTLSPYFIQATLAPKPVD